MKLRIAIAGAASIMLAMMAEAALAGEAQVADGGANVRSGPGPGYRIIASLPAGKTVDVGRCSAGGQWCRVSIRGGSGWVAFSRLAFPYTGRPGEEHYQFGDAIGADGEPSQGYVKLLGIVVDKPGYCYALSHSGMGIIVKCP